MDQMGLKVGLAVPEPRCRLRHKIIKVRSPGLVPDFHMGQAATCLRSVSPAKVFCQPFKDTTQAYTTVLRHASHVMHTCSCLSHAIPFHDHGWSPFPFHLAPFLQGDAATPTKSSAASRTARPNRGPNATALAKRFSNDVCTSTYAKGMPMYVLSSCLHALNSCPSTATSFEMATLMTRWVPKHPNLFFG